VNTCVLLFGALLCCVDQGILVFSIVCSSSPRLLGSLWRPCQSMCVFVFVCVRVCVCVCVYVGRCLLLRVQLEFCSRLIVCFQWVNVVYHLTSSLFVVAIANHHNHPGLRQHLLVSNYIMPWGIQLESKFAACCRSTCSFRLPYVSRYCVVVVF
jgi:hypothetical protein